MHYFVHSIIPIFHSAIVPIIKIIKIIIIFQFILIKKFSVSGIGIINAISTSKIRNKIAIIKNWLVILVFFSVWEWNPHSKFDLFSFESSMFFLKVFSINSKIVEIIMEIKIMFKVCKR